jgi:CBS domain-containing protein
VAVAQGTPSSQLKTKQESGAMEETGSYRIPSVEHTRVRDAMNSVPATGIPNEATLIGAIEVMREQRTSHLIVTDAESGHPTGMISALDIAGIVGRGEG